MQVRGTSEFDRIVIEDADEVTKVSPVPTDLVNGMQHRTESGHPAQIVRIRHRLDVRPLLQLDHDVRGLAGPRMHPTHDNVGTLARLRQPILDQHLRLAQAGRLQIACQDRQAACPSTLFAFTGSAPVGEHEGLAQPMREKVLTGFGGQ
ncbi:hypothetical protein KGQ19_35865 [Catenulispora sp. NL8]|uniref:Uncharacterized protein n=1 Tax=Catenulispora pinistramenti TaxID=2705254 RepID=A0ABS5L1Q5_9ACTN|nr:hypothetical protein [Catenulispora pinistramenti]MBS2552246.1 hypothetical protein [Catenulispora pinistramenti]